MFVDTGFLGNCNLHFFVVSFNVRVRTVVNKIKLPQILQLIEQRDDLDTDVTKG